jgi:hypothetical protein
VTWQQTIYIAAGNQVHALVPPQKQGRKVIKLRQTVCINGQTKAINSSDNIL